MGDDATRGHGARQNALAMAKASQKVACHGTFLDAWRRRAAISSVSFGDVSAGFLPGESLCWRRSQASAPAAFAAAARPLKTNEKKNESHTRSRDFFGAGGELLPAKPVAAQNPVGGAIVGGAVGGIIGGALGRGPGAVAGAVIGATAGAAIAAEAQRRNNGYYWWHDGCYYRYPDGSWLQVAPGYC